MLEDKNLNKEDSSTQNLNKEDSSRQNLNKEDRQARLILDRTQLQGETQNSGTLEYWTQTLKLVILC